MEPGEGETKGDFKKGSKAKPRVKAQVRPVDPVLLDNAPTKPAPDADAFGSMHERDDGAPERVFVDTSNRDRVTAIFKDGTRRILGILAWATVYA